MSLEELFDRYNDNFNVYLHIIRYESLDLLSELFSKVDFHIDFHKEMFIKSIDLGKLRFAEYIHKKFTFDPSFNHNKAIVYASQKGHEHIVEYLLTYDSSNSIKLYCIFNALLFGHYGLALQLLKN
jgi:hypothetical protein